MLALLETLFDILRLRKGPDAIPDSTMLLLIIIAFWFGANMVATLLVPQLTAKGPAKWLFEQLTKYLGGTYSFTRVTAEPADNMACSLRERTFH